MKISKYCAECDKELLVVLDEEGLEVCDTCFFKYLFKRNKDNHG